jgi:nucleoside phosphorylase
MLKILIVEDNDEKRGNVKRRLANLPECDADNLDTAEDSTSAKRLLKERQYDLVILDIALPSRVGEDPVPTGGIDLLVELLDRDIYTKPMHIVGLTAFRETLDLAGARFGEDLWSVVFYEPTSDEWFEKIQKKVRYISLAKSGALNKPEYETNLCVVTAVSDPELLAVLRLPWEWKEDIRPSDCTVYHRGKYKRDGEECSVVAACAPRMGMTAASVLSMKMILTFRPRYIAMVGMLAGVRGQSNMGDVVAADPAWDYGSGKHHMRDGARVFSPHPHQLGLDSFIRSNLFRVSQDTQFLHELRERWPGQKPDTVLKVHVAPVACGAAVLADEKIVNELIKEQNRKVAGIDMETYGVMCAADESPYPIPKAFCLKSVCDFANPDKDSNWQAYASYTSASVLKALAEEYLS